MDRKGYIGGSERRGAPCCAFALLLSVLLAGAAHAFVVPGMEVVRVQVGDPWPPAITTQRGSVSLAEATSMALQRYPGRVVRAETVARGNRVEHHVRILAADGRVRTVRIDAQTGQFL